MKYFLILISIVLLSSCEDIKKPEKPENLISKQTMIQVLTDAYLSNAARSLNSREIRDNALQLDSIIYKKYGIDSLQFVKSNAFYISDMTVYTELFEGVEKSLDAHKKLADSLAREKKKLKPGQTEKDSLERRTLLSNPLIQASGLDSLDE